MRKNWNIKPVSDQVKTAGHKLRVLPPITQTLLNRGIDPEDFQAFLFPSLLNLNDPFDLPDMAKACDAVKTAVSKNEKIFVVGDYDVDGVTSLAIFNEFAKHTPQLFQYFIPHRTQDGYGLSLGAVDKAVEFGSKLMICFDCGTNAVKEIDYALSQGIKVIVIDHHQVQQLLPQTLGFINPKRPDSDYPFKELSSGALSFKFLQALTKSQCHESLDLAALSIVCDVVPLIGENRILLKEGLKVLRKTQRPGILALCQEAKLKQANIESFHLGFILGPRINACGRMAHAQDALNMFLSSSKEEAVVIAKQLCAYNQQRKDIELDIVRQAEEKITKELLEDYAIVVTDDSWHQGVLGIVASRLAEKYYRPAFVISFNEGDLGKGSGRSIHSVHLVDALEKCSQYLAGFGGHKKAAGLQIKRGQVDDFRREINAFLKNTVALTDLVPVLDIDYQVRFSEITMQLVEQMQLLAPFGEGNRQPIFATLGVQKKGSPQKFNSGYNVWFSADNRTFEGVVYDKSLIEILNFGQNFDIAYYLDRNPMYNTPKVVIKDVRLAG